MGTERTDADTAAGIAKDVKERSGRRGGWREMRTLMSDFEVDRLSDDQRRRMATALRDAGLQVQPPLEDVDRTGTVVLTHVSTSQGPRPPAEVSAAALERVLTVRMAAKDAGLREAQLDDRPTDGVCWIDLAATADLDPAVLQQRLNGLCRGQLTLEMAEDLVSPDPKPKVHRCASAPVSNVSAFRALACESDKGAKDDSQSMAGVLVFEPVEFLVGPDWIITAWHDAEIYRGANRVNERRPAPPDALPAEVERCWRRGEFSSGGDLAVLILQELALSYDCACRTLAKWEEEWELDFLRRRDRLERDTLIDVRASASVLRDWITPLHLAGMRQDIEKAWFPGITGSRSAGGVERALEVDRRIGEALHGVQELNDALRGAFDLLTLRESDHDRKRDEAFQRSIAVGGSAILVPSLVAGIMGANTWVPGQFSRESPHWAFLVLLVLIVASGAAAYFALRHLRHGDERTA